MRNELGARDVPLLPELMLRVLRDAIRAQIMPPPFLDLPIAQNRALQPICVFLRSSSVFAEDVLVRAEEGLGGEVL